MKTIEELQQLLADAQANIDAFKRTANLLARHSPGAYNEQLAQLQRDHSVIAGQLNQMQYDARIQAHKDLAHATGEANRAKLAEERAAQLEQAKLDKAAAMRAKSLAEWIADGGTVEEHEKHWDDIRIRILTDSNVSKLTAPPAPDAFTRWQQRQNGRVVAQ